VSRSGQVCAEDGAERARPEDGESHTVSIPSGACEAPMAAAAGSDAAPGTAR